jgi:hypothetical protein
MSLETNYSIVNTELSKKFEIQTIDRNSLPVGDLLQISVPNSTSNQKFTILI